MALKDEIEVLKKENEEKDKKIEALEKHIKNLEEMPKTKLIKLLNKELDTDRNRLTTDFLAGIELLTKSISNLGGE